MMPGFGAMTRATPGATSTTWPGCSSFGHTGSWGPEALGRASTVTGSQYPWPGVPRSTVVAMARTVSAPGEAPPRTSGVAAAAAAGNAAKGGRIRQRILPRSVLGIASLILALAIGAGFSGVVLYSYY